MTPDQHDRSASRALQAAAQDIRRRLNESTPLESLILEMAGQQLRLDQLASEVRVLAAQLLVRDLMLPQAADQYRGNTSAVVDAGMPLDGDAGFYPLEYDDIGQSFRWTGPEPVFRFDLHLDRSAALEFRLVVNAASGLRPEATRAFCDGAEMPCESSLHGHRLELSGVLPPRDVLGLTRIYFQPAQMFRPSELATGSDDRLLGLVFRELRVSALDEEEARRRLARVQTLRPEPTRAMAPLLASHMAAPLPSPETTAPAAEPADDIPAGVTGESPSPRRSTTPGVRARR